MVAVVDVEVAAAVVVVEIVALVKLLVSIRSWRWRRLLQHPEPGKPNH